MKPRPNHAGHEPTLAPNDRPEATFFGLAFVQLLLYTEGMKKRDLEAALKERGWYFLRHGGNHDTWTNGQEIEQIPRHREINEILAKKIIRAAERHPAPKKEK